MNRNSPVYFRTKVFCLLIAMGGILNSRASTVYVNTFDSRASLNGLTIVGQSIALDTGQLRIDPVGAQNTYVVANTTSFAAPYSPILKNNPGTVTWAFNVSNQDAASYLNTGFFFCVGSDSMDPTVYTSFSYLLCGGAFVGNRMEFNGGGPAFPSELLFEIPSAEGLGPLPSKGSFRITYEPSTDLWSVFGDVGSDYVDPTTVTHLLGSVVDSTYTGVPLSYMAFGGQNSGSDFFDNISVSVVPEPSTISLVVLAAATGFVSRFRKRSAQPGTCTGRRGSGPVSYRTSLARRQ